MENNKEYIKFLKQIIACISHGDYFAVKELSQLELDKTLEQTKKLKKEEIL